MVTKGTSSAPVKKNPSYISGWRPSRDPVDHAGDAKRGGVDGVMTILPNVERPWEGGAQALTRKLEGNEYYPYTKWDSNHLFFKERPYRFYLARGVTIVSLLTFVAMAFGVEDKTLLVVPGFPLILGFLFAWCDRHKRRYTLNHVTKEYTFTLGPDTYRGGYHSVYIRLRSKRNNDTTRYYLILNGFMMDRKDLCGFDEDYEELSRLGMRLAETLNINYFDDINVSKYHVVRHMPQSNELLTLSNDVDTDTI